MAHEVREFLNGQAAAYPGTPVVETVGRITGVLDRWEALADLAVCPYCDGSGYHPDENDEMVRCSWHLELDRLKGNEPDSV